MLGRLRRNEIERIIGAGMGIVLKGFDSELNRPVAIKLLAPHPVRIEAARQRFSPRNNGSRLRRTEPAEIKALDSYFRCQHTFSSRVLSDQSIGARS
jgi:hypothetical protein